MIEQRNKPYQYDCEECKEMLLSSRQWDGQGIPKQCVSCHPDIIDANLDAWNIYNFSFDGMGFSMAAASDMCIQFEVRDSMECLFKVRELHGEIKKLEENEEKNKPHDFKGIG